MRRVEVRHLMGGQWRRRGRPDIAPGTIGTRDRSTLVIGVDKPDATITGLTGPLTATQATNITYSGTTPQTISDTRFQGYVYLTGSNRTFINCLFEGPIDPVNESVVAAYAGSSNNQFIDCQFRPRSVNDVCGTIIGRGITLLRCDLSYGVDGVGASPEPGGTRCDFVMEQCYIHDLAFFCPSPTHADNETHNDVVQVHGGAGVTLRGNVLTGKAAPDVGDPGPATYSSSAVTSGNPLGHTGGNIFAPTPGAQGISCLMINQLNGPTLLP